MCSAVEKRVCPTTLGPTYHPSLAPSSVAETFLPCLPLISSGPWAGAPLVPISLAPPTLGFRGPRGGNVRVSFLMHLGQASMSLWHHASHSLQYQGFLFSGIVAWGVCAEGKMVEVVRGSVWVVCT